MRPTFPLSLNWVMSVTFFFLGGGDWDDEIFFRAINVVDVGATRHDYDLRLRLRLRLRPTTTSRCL